MIYTPEQLAEHLTARGATNVEIKTARLSIVVNAVSPCARVRAHFRLGNHQFFLGLVFREDTPLEDTPSLKRLVDSLNLPATAEVATS